MVSFDIFDNQGKIIILIFNQTSVFFNDGGTEIKLLLNLLISKNVKKKNFNIIFYSFVIKNI